MTILTGVFYISEYDKKNMLKDIKLACKECPGLAYIGFKADFLGKISYDLYDFKPPIKKNEIVMELRDIFDTLKINSPY